MMIRCLSLFLALAAIAGCGGGAGGPDAVSGTITSHQAMNIAPNATVHVELVQTTNGSETVVRDTTFQLASQQAPIPFSLSLGDHKMAREDRYLVRAHVMGDAGQPMYGTPTGVPITAAAAGNVEVVVEAIGGMTMPGDTTAGDTSRMRDTGTAHHDQGGADTGGH